MTKRNTPPPVKNNVLNYYLPSSKKHKVFTGLVNVELGNRTCTDRTFSSISLVTKIIRPTDHKERLLMFIFHYNKIIFFEITFFTIPFFTNI